MKEMEMRKFGWIVLAAFLGAAGLGGIASAGQSDAIRKIAAKEYREKEQWEMGLEQENGGLL